MNHFITSFLRHLIITCLGVAPLGLLGQWASAGSGFTGNSLKVYSIAMVDTSTIWAVPRDAQFDEAALFFTRSLNGGATWDARSFQASGDLTPVHIFALDGDIAWMCLTDFNDRDGAGMLKTTNGGIAWTTLTGDFTQTGHNLKAAHFFDANAGVAFGSTGTNAGNQDNLHIYRTTDGGATWTTLSNLPAIDSGEGSWTDAGNGGYEVVGDNIWFGSTTGRVWYSTDQGATWAASSTGFSGNNTSVSSVAFRDANNGLAVSEGNQVARTTNGGASWSVISSPTTPPSTIGIEYVPGTAGTYVIWDGPFNSRDHSYTNDEGDNWATISGGGFSMDCMVFANADFGLGGSAVTNAQVGGVYRWDGKAPGVTGLFGVAEETRFSLYPNPAQGSVNVVVEDAGPFFVEVWDLNGRSMGIAGKGVANSLELDIQDLQPGLYLMQVRQGERSVFEKFTVY